MRGDTVEISDRLLVRRAIRVEFFGDEIDRISEINAVSGMPERVISHVAIYPASHYVASRDKPNRAILEIEREMEERERWFKEHDKLLEAQRIRQRARWATSRCFAGDRLLQRHREPFPRHFRPRARHAAHDAAGLLPEGLCCLVDESHVTPPQVRAMYAGDCSRKRAFRWNMASACQARSTTAH